MKTQRWLVWSLFLLLWTIGLLYPFPPKPHEVEELISPYRFAIAKTVHVSAYAMLAVLTGWLRIAPRYRWLLLFAIMTHGTATEMGQWYTKQMGWSERTGELYDVAFDNAGIFLGLLVSWKWWTEDRADGIAEPDFTADPAAPSAPTEVMVVPDRPHR